MIRLIASDMDGTLLRKDGTIHQGMVPLIRKLREEGIYFVIASGRPVFNLRNIFRKVREEIGLIAFNGAWYAWGEKEYPGTTVEKNVCREAILEARKYPELDCFLDAIDRGYVENGNSPYLRWKEAEGKVEKTDLLDVVEKDAIYRVKLSGFELDRYPPVIDNILPRFQGRAEVIRADANGVDVSGLGNGKGNALANLQRLLGVSPAETMVFGDYYNDLSLFEYAEHRIAMGNACDELKKKATVIAKNHDMDAVYHMLSERYRKGDWE